MSSATRLIFGVVVSTTLALAGAARAGEAVTVFAAASLTEAMTAVGAAHSEASGVAVRFSFAASSTLARQIEAGAPADIFASANVAWMDRLESLGRVDAASRSSLGSNRLVLVVPRGAANSAAPQDIGAVLRRDGRIAVGDPDHVPAGIYAREALTTLGLWRAVSPRLARADNVRSALALVERGEAPVGIVYATDAAITEGVRIAASLPVESHSPIAYPVAIVAGAERHAVRALFAFMTSDAAAAIFARFGFLDR